MSSLFCERLTLAHFLAPVPILREGEDPLLAVELEDAARRFCASLADHRKSDAYQVRLRPPVDFGVDAFAQHLLQAADLLRQGGDEQAGMGAWCCALAARLRVLLGQADAATARVLVFVELDQAGQGELWLAPYDPTDAAALFAPEFGGKR